MRQREIVEACLKLLPLSYRLLPFPQASDGSAQPGGGPKPALMQQRSPQWLMRRTVDKLREGTFWSTAGRYWRKRQALQAGQRPVKEITIPTQRSVISVDPSEAIRSSEIVPVLKEYFEIVEYRPLGGSILQFLLADIAGNFRDAQGQRLLEILFQLEDVLMACDDLPSDFAYIVAAPKVSGG